MQLTRGGKGSNIRFIMSRHAEIATRYGIGPDQIGGGAAISVSESEIDRVFDMVSDVLDREARRELFESVPSTIAEGMQEKVWRMRSNVKRAVRIERLDDGIEFSGEAREEFRHETAEGTLVVTNRIRAGRNLVPYWDVSEEEAADRLFNLFDQVADLPDLLPLDSIVLYPRGYDDMKRSGVSDEEMPFRLRPRQFFPQPVPQVPQS